MPHFFNKNLLWTLWKSKQELYWFYIKECEREDLKGLSLATLHNLISDRNYSLLSPKKDQCDTCVGNKCRSTYTIHLRRKGAARKEKKADKYQKSGYSPFLLSVAWRARWFNGKLICTYIIWFLYVFEIRNKWRSHL